jgi:hypothetical protein
MDYQLSEHAVKRLRERRIDENWIQSAIDQPDRVEADPMDADEKHGLKIIPEMENRVLRVVYNETKNPVLIISAFFDRRMKGRL